MYQVSEKVNEYLLGDNRMFNAKITVGSDEIASGFISVKQFQQSNSSDFISIGDAVASSIEVKMWQTDGVQLENREFELSIAPLVEEEVDYIPFGVYTATNIVQDNGIMSFTAYDRMFTKMSGTYNSVLEYPTDGKNIINEISEMTGVPVDLSNIPDGVIIHQKQSSVEMTIDEDGNPVTAIKYSNPYDGYSYRDVISFISQFYCKFATIDRHGTLVFRWYDFSNISYYLEDDRYYDDLSVNEEPFSVSAITCLVGDKTIASGLGVSSIQLENPVMTQEYLDNIYEQVKNLFFYPISTSFFGDPRVDLGDVIMITARNGSELTCPLMNITQDYDGGFITSISSFGGNKQESGNNSPVYEKLAKLQSEIYAVNELIGKKADFETIMAQMITVNKVIFGDMTLVDFYNQMIESNASISKTLDGLLIDVSSLSNKKDLSDNSSVQNYDSTEVPTLNNYPTITEFFIWDKCSNNLYCSEKLICGTNDYESHISEITYNQTNDGYYVFERNTEGFYAWRKMSSAEVSLLADRYASVSVSEGLISMAAGYENERCDVSITHEGLRATVLYCC